MKTRILFNLILLFSSASAFSQYEYSQYFDGSDTLVNSSIIIHLDTAAENIWQIGEPQKIIFDSANTISNAIVTDTLNNYPINNTSSFIVGVDPTSYGWGGFLSLQWMQKLDLDDSLDGGYIEYSIDTGATWTNVFNDPFVYNFYGFDQNNKDTLVNGDVAFSGVDSTWSNVWLCFDFSWLSLNDTLTFRFTLKSDGIENNREGWMIDNMFLHPTWFHTINETDQKEYLIVYPNPTTGIVNIKAKKFDDFHIIELMEVVDINGKIVKTYEMVPTKFTIDLSDQPNGVYFLKIKTNIKTEVFRIILENER